MAGVDVVAKGMTDGDAPTMRDGASNIVAATVVVVLPCVDVDYDGLRVGSIVGFNSSGNVRSR